MTRDRALRPRALALAGGFAVILVTLGLLRAGRLDGTPIGALAGLATPLYIAATILAGVLLIRAGASFRRFGFEQPFDLRRHVLGATLAMAVIGGLSVGLGPLWEALFGAGRDLDRFADVVGDPGALVRLLALSWTVAAFGEEIAFRIVLMRGLAYALGDGRGAWVAALILQAAVFGLVHLYQGPAGVAGTAVNALVYGTVVLAARGSIWPAVLAHGGSNTVGILMLYLGAAGHG